LGAIAVAHGEGDRDLEVLGDLIVWDKAVLTATGAADSGFLKGAGTIKVEGTGTVVLPYDPDHILNRDFITYLSENVTVFGESTSPDETTYKAIGSIVSYVANDVTVSPLTTQAQITTVFDTLDEVTVYNIPGTPTGKGLATNPVPYGKTLTLTGNNNNLTDTATTFNPGGTLVIAGTLKISSAITTVYPRHIEILESGVLALGNATGTFTGELAAGANKGKITTVATTGAALAALLPHINGEIEATATLATAFTATLTVPKGVSLTLAPPPTVTSLAATDVNVEGKLTIGETITAFEPTGDVTIVEPATGTAEENTNNGVLVLAGAATQSITIKNTKKLWIQNPKKISGAGLIIAQGGDASAEPKGVIAIGFVENTAPPPPLVARSGYTTPAAGVAVGKIVAAVTALDDLDTKVLYPLNLVTGDYAADNPTTGKGLGTVEITGTTPTEVKNGAASVELPAGISLATAIGSITTTSGANATTTATPADFTLGTVAGTTIFTIADSAYTGTAEKLTYLTFNGAKFTHDDSGLVSPERPFHIGIKTKRTS
jgi:hypothetical protein